MDWINLPPCFQCMPEPVFYIYINGTKIPVMQAPEEILSEPLRGKGIWIYFLAGFFTPSYNIKWIPAQYMLGRGIETGFLEIGDDIVEPTSGSFGISLAYCAAREERIRDYRLKVRPVISDSLEPAKIMQLERCGARIIRESEATRMLGLHTSPGSIELTRLMAERYGWKFFNQYSSAWNWESYYYNVAPQLWRGIKDHATGAGIDWKRVRRMLVTAIGSTGTFYGNGRYFREKCKKEGGRDIELVATQPYRGQKIGGTRDEVRIREITHPWQTLNPVIERIDEGAAGKYGMRLNRAGIPGGESSGAAVGTIDHLLSMGEPENTIIITTFGDMSSVYPNTFYPSG